MLADEGKNRSKLSEGSRLLDLNILRGYFREGKPASIEEKYPAYKWETARMRGWSFLSKRYACTFLCMYKYLWIA